MSRNRAILLTVLGIIAAYFIIRGINAWADKHAQGTQADAPAYRLEYRCARPFAGGAAPSDAGPVSRA